MLKKKKDCSNLDQQLRDGDDEQELLAMMATCLGEEIRRYAQAKCGGTRGDLDDITQDAMLAANKYLKSFRGDASLRTWLYQLVISACSHRRRGQKNNPQLHHSLDSFDAVPPIAHTANPELELLLNERLSILEAALADLKPQDRALLAAVEWEDKSLKQVAEQNGLTISAIKSRLFRIRQQLRETISERVGH